MAEPTGKTCVFVAILFTILQYISVVQGITVTTNGTLILDDNAEIRIDFDPPEITGLQVKHEQHVYFNVSVLSYGTAVGHFIDEENTVSPAIVAQNVADDIVIRVECDQKENAVISGSREFRLVDVLSKNAYLNYSLDANSTDDDDAVYFTVRGLFLGYTRVKFYINGSVIVSNNTLGKLELLHSENGPPVDGQYQEDRTLLPIDYKVAIIREERIVNNIFIAAVAILVFISNMGMGCKVDLAVIKDILKKPVAPTIGFFCQYIIMPLASFASLTMMGLEGGVALGLFAAGCAPGGSGSNMYTYLLDGDVSLSVTMTFISTLASLFMIPAWLYTLGQFITGQDTMLKIPITNIFISLISLLIPVAIGMIIRKKKPDIARGMDRVLKPFFIGLILFMFTFGVWVNLYIFRLMTLTLCIAGATLPYLGFLLGGLIAFICRQPWARVITIAIETGLQNTGIPILLLKFSLPQPNADMSIVSPVVTSIFTPIPLFTAVIIYEIRRHCCKKATKVNEPQEAVTNIMNGDTLPEPQYTEDDLITPDDPKSEKPGKLLFDFEESGRVKK